MEICNCQEFEFVFNISLLFENLTFECLVAGYAVLLMLPGLFSSLVPNNLCLNLYRKDGQDTQDELKRRNLRDELDERERRHFSSKNKFYNGKN